MSSDQPTISFTTLTPDERTRLDQITNGRGKLACYAGLTNARTQANLSHPGGRTGEAIEAALIIQVAECRAAIADADATTPAIVAVTPRSWRLGDPPHAS